MDSETHIIPLMVGDADLCKMASDHLLKEHDIYIQPINYPTVPRGTERLRITPTPLHSAEHIESLIMALNETWNALGITKRLADNDALASSPLRLAVHRSGG